MGYRTLRDCVIDLERTNQLVRVSVEIDPRLEAAEIQRRVYAAGGPAVFFERVKGCKFPMVSNLFGTVERTRFLFRDAINAVKQLIELKVDPSRFFKQPFRYLGVPKTLWRMWPRNRRRGAVTAFESSIDQLPQLVSWPDDGGAFITLPEVYTEHPNRPGWKNSNLGMYRIQLSGGEYAVNRQVGMHYQIHRSIGIHHAAAIERGEPLRANVLVGGPPAMILSAVMPLPDGVPELSFAGALGGRAIRMVHGRSQLPIVAEADFCICGTIDLHARLPEGPFGDHLGYYSLAHDFPVLNVDKVFHRKDAIWPFTTVGRPPQEDTSFGAIIHEITGPAIPSVVPGVHAVHAVDAAGVHPLLLAIGSERYVPYADNRRPQELLTCANAILGQGQLSLAKYLMIVAREDGPSLEIENIPAFMRHLLERVDWRTDLHFQTCTTIDTLDYSGTGLNSGSKLVIAAAGRAKRELPERLPIGCQLPNCFRNPEVCLPGVLIVEAGEFADHQQLELACQTIDVDHPINRFPLVVVADDSAFTARTVNNFVWTTFTRSNPAADIYGIGASVQHKHWGCTGSVVIDARIKPHHAPPLIEDPAVTRRVDELAAPGGPLHGVI